MNTIKTRAVQNGKTVALLYISDNPEKTNEKVATIVPLTRSGEWKDNDLRIESGNPHTAFFEGEILNETIEESMLNKVGIYRGDVVLHQID